MQQLPDLVPWMPTDRPEVFDWSIQGDEMRLTTAILNQGEGALEIRGGAETGDTQEVFQRIYNDDGTSTDTLAGEFINHPEHGHIHFEDFTQFRLREVTPDGGVGEVVAEGDKVSFCLIDIENFDSNDPSTYRTCGNIQGISSGWADVYDKGLPGQSIDISAVANGDYWLEYVVDPLDLLTEADETNNVTRSQITIDRDVNPPGGDNFEANNGFAAASTLTPPQDFLYENLSVHTADDEDYFRVTATDTGDLTFKLDFDHAAGDLDMRVYDADQNQLAISQSVTNTESVTVAAQAGEQFYVRVYGYNDATNDYSLLVDQPGHDHGGHDNVVADIPNETQFLTGDPDHNDVFVIDGAVADYSWGPTQDGEGIVVWGPTGADLLYDFDWIDFNDASIGTAPDTGGGDGIADIQNVTQFLTGTGDADNFIIDGTSGDYNWGATQDGTGTVVWGPTGFDILTGFETITFNDQAIDLNAAPPTGGLTVNDDPSTTQYEFGTDETDTFVIAADSTDYAWGNTSDGGIVVWNQATLDHDILYDFEEIQFDDTTIDDFA